MSDSVDPASVHSIQLRSGVQMPAAAYGTFHSDWAQDLMKDATVEAIRLGWRHIDTARAYENEHLVGEAIREAIAKGYIKSADDLFITGKLWNGHMDPADVIPAAENTLKSLGVEKIDMYLNHWPWPNVHAPGAGGDERNPHAVPYIHEQFMETWGEILKLKKAGKVVDVGTSNHTRRTCSCCCGTSRAMTGRWRTRWRCIRCFSRPSYDATSNLRVWSAQVTWRSARHIDRRATCLSSIVPTCKTR